MSVIYLDYNATTPVDPAVKQAMLPYFEESFGNPSSSHALGVSAHQAVEEGRSEVARLIGARPEEIIFTSGGTEASNLAIKGVFFARLTRGISGWLRRAVGGESPHMVISAFEHPATSKPVEFLRKLGCLVSVVPVSREGFIDPGEVKRALRKETILVSLMHANNEVGTIQPIREISQITRSRGIPLHVDAAQSLGKIPTNVDELGVDLLTIAGHKLYAPKGVGALYCRTGIHLESWLHGAGHENGRRAGTENVPYIVGLGKACRLAGECLAKDSQRLRAMTEGLWSAFRDAFGDTVALNGHLERRLPNTLNLSFVGQKGSELLQKLPGIAASTGSACHEGQVHQSPVLCAMGVPPEIGAGAVRLSLGRFTTDEDISRALELFCSALGKGPSKLHAKKGLQTQS